MRIFENSHSPIMDQVANAVVHSATSRTVGALMRGHSVLIVVLIAAALIGGVWAFKRFFSVRGKI
jgi:hypothetical protein